MVKVGDRIYLLKTTDPYIDLTLNEYIGRVFDINYVNLDEPFTQIWVKFDNGSQFALIPEFGDKFKVISKL
ncbi:MAG: hypothetical protein GWN01_05450 [Nitrosopumilaceae archaeon]|nr:hypothetical protein [Nitrosopumilaceae archaeon]NIU86790.1 hypothetical protein [Nitrosopumilaceae archaeon]NIX60990.1 hypothetical protein [Nitrosopumilaceae archaeon]